MTNAQVQHRFRVAVGVAGLMALAVVLDRPVAAWAVRHAPTGAGLAALSLLKVPGHFGFTLVVAAAFTVRHRGRWRPAALVCGGGALAGLLVAVVKWVVGRTRPGHGMAPFALHPFRGGMIGLFHEANLSFPSGHTALAFSTAAAVAALSERWCRPALAVAAVVGLERVLQGSHYASDVAAAAVVGVASTLLVRAVMGPPEPDGRAAPPPVCSRHDRRCTGGRTDGAADPARRPSGRTSTVRRTSRPRPGVLPRRHSRRLPTHPGRFPFHGGRPCAS